MQVKIIRDYRANLIWIRKNQVYKVRLLGMHPFDLFPRVQITEGLHSGVFLPREIFIELSEEKTFTEKEWNDMENHYMNLLDQERKKVSEFQDAGNKVIRDFTKLLQQAAVAKQVSVMLDKWLNEDYDGDKKADRENFSLKLTNFIQEKLV